MKSTKFAVGCLVQWYECDILPEYIDTLIDAVNQYDGDVLVDFMVCTDETLEKCVSNERRLDCVRKISGEISAARKKFKAGTKVISTEWDGDTPFTIAEYRRDFNSRYCDDVHVLFWGESDMLVPKRTFEILHHLHNQAPPKWIATFGICKMWDDSWKDLEHPMVRDKEHSDNPDDWWGIKHIMSKEEMHKINDVEDIDVKEIRDKKFNGCGLAISSDLVRVGVNIPPCMFFIHEDTALMNILKTNYPNVPQFHISNIFMPHHRKHPNKRMWIKGEENVQDTTAIGKMRSVHDWYNIANGLSESNAYRLFNDKRLFTWDDVWENVKFNANAKS